MGAGRLVLHQLEELGGVASRGQVGGRDAEALEILLGQIDAPGPGVGLNVAHDVGQLERHPEIDGVLARPHVRVAEDLDAAEPDGGRDAVAVGVELVEGLVGGAIEVHLHARDDLVERLARDREELHRRLQPLSRRVRRRAVEDLSDFRAPALELLALGGSVLPDVDRVVHDAAEGVDGVERLALGPRQAEKRVEEIGAALARQPRHELGGVHFI